MTITSRFWIIGVQRNHPDLSGCPLGWGAGSEVTREKGLFMSAKLRGVFEVTEEFLLSPMERFLMATGKTMNL